MNLTNFILSLNDILKRYMALLDATVHIKTGALKRSLELRQNNNDFIVSMLSYGAKDSVWDNGNPLQKLNRTLAENKSILEKSFARDIKEGINKDIKK